MSAATWGRANRGRTWHCLRVDGMTFCKLDEEIIEWQPDRPPMGGRVCRKCKRIIDELYAAVALACADEVQKWNDGAIADATILDAPEPVWDVKPEDVRYCATCGSIPGSPYAHSCCQPDNLIDP